MYFPKNEKKRKCKFTVLICTLGNKDLLKRCIDSLVKQTYKNFEVLIIDQGQSPLKDELIYDGIKIRYFQVNWKGLSKARNYGMRLSRAEYIVFLDDDGVLHNDFLQNIEALIKNKKEIAAFAGIVLDDITKKPIGRSIINKKELEINFTNLNQWMSSATAVQVNAIKQIGGYDEEFGAGAKYGGSEDTDILIRLLANQNKAYFTKSLIVYHPSEGEKLNEMSFRQSCLRGYRYGYGRGACLKKALIETSENLFIRQWFISLLYGILGCFYSILSFNVKMFLKDFASLLGRVEGFYAYSKS